MMKNVKKAVKKILKHFMLKEVKTCRVTTVVNDLLKGKIALITGGSGGIGFAISKRFVESGCHTILIGTNEKKLKENCEKLGNEMTRYLVCDLSDVSETRETVEKAWEVFAPERLGIDILVNSAGFHGPSVFSKITEEDYDKVMGINLKSTFFMCQIVSEYMIKHSRKGHILNVSSASSIKPAWTPYEISKWGVRGFTLGLARELITYGIVVNAIAPGPVATPMLNMGENDNLSCPGNPSGRVATPEDIANLALFMASDLGDYIVGDSFFITGGSGTICIDK
jgi:NAD(P)-dependent dehydrogenase (short-subunit alcohol dehydrogenase family)